MYPVHSNYSDCITHSPPQYGVREGLFKGLSWRVALIGTTFFLVNKFKQVVTPVLYDDL